MRYIKENRRNFYGNLTTFETLKLRFLNIPMNKVSHFVVCYRKYQDLTYYIGLRPLESLFGKKISFFAIFWLFWPFCILKLRFLKISKNNLSHFVLCYRRHLKLTFYIGYKLVVLGH